VPDALWPPTHAGREDDEVTAAAVSVGGPAVLGWSQWVLERLRELADRVPAAGGLPGAFITLDDLADPPDRAMPSMSFCRRSTRVSSDRAARSI
jgi:hypothetical protein